MFEDFLESLPEDRRPAMRRVVEHVATLVPEATEGMSYGMPAFRYRDKPLLGMQAARAHLSLHPFSPEAIEAVADQLDGLSTSKGTVRFTERQEVPTGALTGMVQARRQEIDGG